MTGQLVAAIDDAPTHLAIACERGFLAALDGSCRTPIAGLAEIEDGRLRFRGEVLTLDGRSFWTASRDIAFDDSMGEYARTQAYAAGQDAARNRAGKSPGRNSLIWGEARANFVQSHLALC